MRTSPCRSCGAPLLWAVTERGKRMPLSAASEERRFVVTENGGETACSSQLTYLSHWAECPNADNHRKET